MFLYLLVFVVAFFVTILLTPVVRSFAPKLGAVDSPNERKMHAGLVPRLGGVAIFLGFLVAVAIGLLLKGRVEALNLRAVGGILLGGTLILGVGILDDIKRLSPPAKLFFQIIAAGIVIYFGVEITFISNPFNGMLVLSYWSVPITIFWLVGLTNAINLIDGLDGLAGGVVTIAALSLFLVAAFAVHETEAALILLALGGATLAFLRYNFFPASIFLGDSGSLFLGFVLAGASIIGVLKSPLVVSLVLPVIILGVPIFDTLLAIVRRAKAGQPIFEADRGHIHHVLVGFGFSRREAVLIIYLACVSLSVIAIVVTFVRGGSWF